MKKIISLLLVLVMLLGAAALCSCSSDEDKTSGNGSGGEVAEPTFENANDQLNYVANKAGKSVLGNVDKIVDKVPLLGGAYTEKVDLKVEVSDALRGIISNMLGDQAPDLSFFKNAGVSIEFANKDKAMGLKAAASLNGTEIANGKGVFDGDSLTVSSNLLSSPLAVNVGALLQQTMGGNSALQMLQSLDLSSFDTSIVTDLLDADFLSDVIGKYFGVALDQIDVTKAEEDVTANGVTEKLTVIRLSVDGKVLKNIAQKALETLKGDKDLIAKAKQLLEKAKKMIEGTPLAEQFGQYLNTVDIDTLIAQYVDPMAEELKDQEEFFGIPTINVAIYLTAKNGLRGAEVTWSDEHSYSWETEQYNADTYGYEYVTETSSHKSSNQVTVKFTENGGKYGFEAKYSQSNESEEYSEIPERNSSNSSRYEYELVSSGAKNGGLISGSATVSYGRGWKNDDYYYNWDYDRNERRVDEQPFEKSDLITVQVESFDLNALEQGNLKGKFSVKAADVFDLIGGGNRTIQAIKGALGSGDYSFTLTLDGNTDSMSVRVAVENTQQPLVAVTMTMTTSNSANLEPISVAKVVDFKDFGDYFSLNKLMENLTKAGVPAELLQMIG